MKPTFAILLSILPYLSFAQIKNDDFELWNTTFTPAYSTELSSIFGVPDPTGGELANWESGSEFGLCRTTDSYSGDYAMILHNWYGYANEWITYHDTLSQRPQYVNGYFKYITGGDNILTAGTAEITLTKFNGISNDTIATGNFQFDSTNVYIPFQIELNYQSVENPDSIKIYFRNADISCGVDIVCNLLYLDKLSLSDTPLNLENITTLNEDWKIYPNPFSHSATLNTIFTMENALIEIYNIYGKKLGQYEKVSGQEFTFYRENMPAGHYFIKITQDHSLMTTHKIVIID
jgi:hypothetical protein